MFCPNIQSQMISIFLNNTFYYLILRQVNPTPDNRAANSLHRNTQIHNIKLVDVNARVTLVIWILETITNASILVTIVIFGQTSLGNTTNAMVWYYLLISYTFLMNTSYNKDRVIESGWKIVIFNAIAGTFRCISKPENMESIQTVFQKLEGNDEKKEAIDLKSLPNIPDSSISNNTSSTSCSSNVPSQSANQDIFVISSPDYDMFQTSSQCCSIKLKDLEKIKSQNRRSKIESKNQDQRILSKSLSADSELSVTDSCQRKSYRVMIGEKIITEMRAKLDDEEAYLYYFRQLVEFEEMIQKVDFYVEKKFEIQPYVTFPIVTYSKIKNANTPSHQGDGQNCKITRRKSIARKVGFDHSQQESMFSEQGLMRMQLRRDVLSNFSIFLNDEEHFDNFVNTFIEFEEDLIKEE